MRYRSWDCFQANLLGPKRSDKKGKVLDRYRGTDEGLLVRLRSGDETAFSSLVDRLHCTLLSLARTFTSSPALAEDIVQETWLAVIRGLRGFEGRSSLRTWIFNILVRRARTLAAREARRSEVSIEFNGSGADSSYTEWEPGRGRVGLWDGPLIPWNIEDPDAVFQTQELRRVLEDALARLPEMQRQVVLLRDVEDVGAADVCNILTISETNQRVLLHRGRARIRRELDRYLRGGKDELSQRRTRAAGRALPRSALISSGAIRAKEERR